MKLNKSIAVFIVLILTGSALFANEARLLRNPDICGDKVVFVYAEDIWISSVNGGEARRLTAFPGVESNPRFSPDRKFIAFTGEYDGNPDVYIIPVIGGEPRRLTWHPAPDLVRGWTKDGKKVVFASNRNATPSASIFKFWTIGINEKMPELLSVPRIFKGNLSPDNSEIVYQMVFPWETEWRNYRGGQNKPIRIINLKTLEVQKLPWDGSNDNTPVWIGNKIYFLSDRDFCMNVWSYDINTKELIQNTNFKELDCKNLESGREKLIFENGGYLYVFNLEDEETHKLSISIHGDFPWARPHWEKVDKMIANYAISPTGKRAIFEARGEIFTVPAKDGTVRNLTNSSGAADRAPVWSPDGQHVSWFSDEGGEYHLVIADQFGENKKKILFKKPTFYYTPVWSPDSKYISFGDADRNLRVVNVESGSLLLIDNEGFAHPERTIYPEWAPDSKWIAYTKRLKNQYNAIFIYSIDKKKSFQLTDGMSDSRSPAWDASGKYLYFLASTNYALNVGWLDLSSQERPIRRAIYMAVLTKDVPSPFLPKSDDEITEKKDDKNNKKDVKDKKDKNVCKPVNVDFKNIDKRILALDLPERNYSVLKAGKEEVLFYLESVPHEGFKLHCYSVKKREDEKIAEGVQRYSVSHNGEKLLCSFKGGKWIIADAKGKINAGKGIINTADMKMMLDPCKEWKQIFREAWRFQRDYFYVKNVHGLDLDWAYRTYSPWVDYVRHRVDLTYILDILGGETSVGHSFTGGGDLPDVKRVPVGLLGADYKIDDGRYRIVKIYNGENWNPTLRAPLSAPGINIREGDYLLSVNGKELNSHVNLYRFFAQTAGKQITITVNSKPAKEGSRKLTVVPVRSESALRQRSWIEANRRKVDKLSNGKLAYVWLPNTSVAGYNSFNRYYFAQQDKRGAVIDERFNQGGSIADYIIDLLSRELVGYFNNPVGEHQPFLAPNAAIYGPKVMIINEMAGSGGDMMPYMFKFKKIGPLVGTRTWGGLVGIWDVPRLIDGGYITAPRGGFYNINGQWDVEGKGIAPDVYAEQIPKMVNAGHDPQLEKAVEVAMELFKKKEFKLLPQPPDPVRVKRPVIKKERR